MRCDVYSDRVRFRRSKLLYGHFIEHFHRQIYGGIYDPASPFADEDGFREDVLDAMRRIHVPILRWPGGCFVSSYHWQKAVGPERTPFFDKAWRVEDPNTFGTNEFVRLCRKLDCEPYICTNAGTGTAEEMSDWLEYCNLENEGEFARMRISHGYPEPHHVRYWSIGNENYGSWEIGAKPAAEWGRLVLEAAKMMKHVDPTAELSAAALTDIDWNVNLLKAAGEHLDWISLHKYWNIMANENKFATYEESMACTADLEEDIRKTRGLLTAFGLEKRVKIAFDEWNLRGWHHPNVHTIRQGITREEYLTPRDLNDRNQDYTMADAVFTACFLNTLNRNADIVGMANFAPIVNTRGCIFTHPDGLVLRSTYLVFDLYVNELGDQILADDETNAQLWTAVDMQKKEQQISCLDILPTKRSSDGVLAVAIVNKHADQAQTLTLATDQGRPESYRLMTVNGGSTEAFNDIGHSGVRLQKGEWIPTQDKEICVTVEAHSVNVLLIKPC